MTKLLDTLNSITKYFFGALAIIIGISFIFFIIGVTMAFFPIILAGLIVKTILLICRGILLY